MGVVGYTWDGDTYCPECTRKRFQYVREDRDGLGVPYRAFDTEGNRVQPIFVIDEWDEDIHCGSCLVLISEGLRKEEY